MTATLSRVGSRSHSDVPWWLVYLAVLASGAMITLAAARFSEGPYVGLSLVLTALLVVGWIFAPLPTLYATLALTATADRVTVWWFPWAKNLSSRESIAFVADALTVSPLDIVLVAGAVVVVIRQYARTGRLVARNPMAMPVAAFTVCVLYGFVRGIGSGGDVEVAVITGRPLLYIGLMFVITANTVQTPANRRNAVLAVGIGVFVQALLSLVHLNSLDAERRSSLESLTEHGSAVAQSAVLLGVVILAVFAIGHRRVRWTFGLLALPILVVFLVSQRRAAIAGLVVAGVAISLMLLWRARRRFMAVVPAIGVLLVGYVVAFWNSSATAAYPVSAIKTMIAPNSVSLKDRGSGWYRVAENFNLNFTIRSDPFRGLGLGRAFYRPIRLPDLSFFELNAYVPHNSVLWIWIALGFPGFVAMLYLLAKAIMIGSSRLRLKPLGTDFAVVLMLTLFVILYAVFSYFDIAWDPRNTVLLGFVVAALTIPSDREEGDREEGHGAAGDRAAGELVNA